MGRSCARHSPGEGWIVSARDPTAIGVKELFQILWNEKVLIVLVTGFSVLLAGIGGVTSKKTYRATVLLSLASNESGTGAGIGALISQLGPLASMAGISGGAVQKSEAVALLQSRTLTQRFIQENELLPVFYPGSWDPQTKTWSVTDPDRIPTLWDGNEIFRKIRTVAQDTKTGLITLNITWTDPVLAAEWANGLVDLTNRVLREEAIRESERNVAYLTGEVAKTELVQVKTALYALVENEIKQAMLARGRDQYALKVIDPAVVPETPSSVRLLVWLIVGLAAGAVLSLLIVFLKAAWRSED